MQWWVAGEVRDRLKSAFNLSEYTLLESDSSGHTLWKCFDQDIDGEDLVRRKGSLYICKTFPQVKDTPHQYVIVFVIIPYSLQIADGDEDLKQPKNQKKKAQLGVKVC